MTMKWNLVVAANSDEILRNNLLRSGETESAIGLSIHRNAPNIGIAYNAGISKSTGDIIVFAHQDVYFPPGWFAQLDRSIAQLDRQDPEWGVAGVFGVSQSGSGIGHVYSTGLKRFVGAPLSQPLRIRTLDEMVLIVRRDSGLTFDEELPGFHLYGTDICMEAESRGFACYALPLFTFHNSRGIKRLPIDFWKAYWYLRRKWRDRLPIQTPCTSITRGIQPIVSHVFRTSLSGIRGRNLPGERVMNPEQLYKDVIAPKLEIFHKGKA